jgi:hypothetical protein
MARVAVISSQMSSQRDTWWFLVQNDDGTLHVKYESKNADGDKTEWEMPINEFLQKSGGGRTELQKLINRMFEDASR